jgi:hypothetical protein
MSYMMEQPHHVSENAHFVGNVVQSHNSPVNIDAEDADEEDGDEVRTVARLVWKIEEDGRVVRLLLLHHVC